MKYFVRIFAPNPPKNLYDSAINFVRYEKIKEHVFIIMLTTYKKIQLNLFQSVSWFITYNASSIHGIINTEFNVPEDG